MLFRAVVLIGLLSLDAVQFIVLNSQLLFALDAASTSLIALSVVILFISPTISWVLFCDSWIFGLTITELLYLFCYSDSGEEILFVLNLLIICGLVLCDARWVFHDLARFQAGKQEGLQADQEVGLVSLQSPSKVVEGRKVTMDKLPDSTKQIPVDVSWGELDDVEHHSDSPSCHIYFSRWRGRPVVVKLMRLEGMKSKTAVGEFEMEAAILRRVEHPNVIELLGLGKDAHSRPFLILEFLSGGTLARALGQLTVTADSRVRSDTVRHQTHRITGDSRRFVYGEALRIMLDLALALKYLHADWHHDYQIIHRDLKPDNIGFDPSGSVKIFDFGLCACVHRSDEQTDTFTLTGNTGTLRYMAPEVAVGKPYNCSVDVYSWAIISWQILTKKVPFSSYGRKSFLEKVVLGGKRPKLPLRWPEKLKDLLTKSWSSEFLERPSIDCIVEDLRALIELQHEVSDKSMYQHVFWSFVKWDFSHLSAKQIILCVVLAVTCGVTSLAYLSSKLNCRNEVAIVPLLGFLQFLAVGSFAMVYLLALRGFRFFLEGSGWTALPTVAASPPPIAQPNPLNSGDSK